MIGKTIKYETSQEYIKKREQEKYSKALDRVHSLSLMITASNKKPTESESMYSGRKSNGHIDLIRNK